MIIDWPIFIAASLLLLSPIGLFHNRKARYQPLAHQWDVPLKQVLVHGLHTIDLLRATLGGWLFSEAIVLAPAAAEEAHYAVLIVQSAVLAVALALQTAVCREPRSVFAPFAFVAGLVLGFFPLATGIITLVLATAVAAGVRAPGAFFPLVAVSLLGIGTLFGGLKSLFPLIAGAVAVTVPWVWTLLFSQQFVISYRAKRQVASASATSRSR
jgi:hypothetical protein